MSERWSDRIRRFIHDHITITKPPPTLQCWFGVGPVGPMDGSTIDGVSVVVGERMIAVHRKP